MRRGSRDCPEREDRAARPAGRWERRHRAAPETESPHRSSQPLSARRAEELGEGWGTTVPRGSVTRQTLSTPPLCRPSQKDGRWEAPAPGRRCECARGSKKVLRTIPKPRTVHAAWRRWSRPSGSTRRSRLFERACASAGRRRWTQLRSAGEARGATEHQRYVDRNGARRRQRSGLDRSARRSGLDGVNRELPHRVGTCDAACTET